MIFLTEDDFVQYQVRTEVLSVLKIAATTLDASELVAMEQVSSYLKTRYDMAAAFEKTGDDRNPLLIMYMIDIIMYHLHSNTANRVMPKSREDRFNAAITWLTSVNSGDLIPNLPSLEANNPDPIYRFGSDERYANRW